MENKQAAVRKARGTVEAYNPSLEVEVWPVDQPRPAAPVVYKAANISLQEFQFISMNPLDAHYRFNFAILFPRASTGKNMSLIVGAARVVGRTQVSTLGADCFVLEARIEEIRSMWDGEEKSPPTRKSHPNSSA
jgi:hypothetical protein